MPEVPPENPKSTIDGISTIENWPYNYGPHSNTPFSNDYAGLGNIELYPQGREPNKDYHPFELEFHIDKNDEVELRCYYGVIYYSIAAIQIEPFDDNDTSDANKRFGIKSQSKLPGIGNLTPAGFISRDDGSNTKYCSLKKGRLSPNGKPPSSSYGTVFLRFFLDSANHKISEADINFVGKDENLDPEDPCGELKRVGTDKLLREEPTKGMYYLKIGSFNAPEDSSVQITQSIEDHVYYATTIIENSEAPAESDGGSYSTTTTADNPNPPESFGPATVDPPADVDETIDASPPVITPNPEDGDSDAASPNQPNNQVNIPGVFPRTDFTTIVDEVVVPSQDVSGTAFGGTGAAGDPGTDDQTDAVTTGDIPGLTEIHKIQSESPQGSPGGSPSSGSFGSTT